jgi:hypothetical protein
MDTDSFKAISVMFHQEKKLGKKEQESLTFRQINNGRDSLMMGYFDNLDNEFSNKYEKIVKIEKKIYKYTLLLIH